MTKQARPRGRPRINLAPKPVQAAPANEAFEAQAAAALDIGGAPMISTRPEMRAEMREEDPRARAARVALELEGQLQNINEAPDDFYVDPAKIPDGWDYEWKRETVLNQEDPAYKVQVEMGGWRPVPAKRHPTYMPSGSRAETIDRKGMRLYERPKVITDKIRDMELRKARNQVRQNDESLGLAPKGHFDRDQQGSELVKVRKTYENIPIPTE